MNGAPYQPASERLGAPCVMCGAPGVAPIHDTRPRAGAAHDTPETPRSWNDGWRCDECCNGDRCDDPSHHDRSKCPHCKGSGIALWNIHAKEREHEDLQRLRVVTEERDRAHENATAWELMAESHFDRADDAEARVRELEGALRELVRLKDLHDEIDHKNMRGDWTTEQCKKLNEMMLDYAQNKPKAWKVARDLTRAKESK